MEAFEESGILAWEGVCNRQHTGGRVNREVLLLRIIDLWNQGLKENVIAAPEIRKILKGNGERGRYACMFNIANSRPWCMHFGSLRSVFLAPTPSICVVCVCVCVYVCSVCADHGDARP